MASKLEGPAKHVYGVYVNQHRTIGISKTISTFSFLLLFSVLMITFWKPANFEEDGWNRHATFFIISSVGMLVMFVATPFFLAGDFNKLLNPEYYAIQDIIKAFK